MIIDDHFEQQLSAETLAALNGEYRNGSFESSSNILLQRQPKIVPVKTLSQFIKEYRPLAYIIANIVTTFSIYTLTAKTGAGKTALNTIIALAVATGREDILGYSVFKGRVVYLAFENPNDVRMRFMIAAFAFGIDINEIDKAILLIDARHKPEDIHLVLQKESATDPLSLIIIDTLQAAFDGNDSNAAVQAGEFIRRVRAFTQISGNPAVLIAAHPIKNAPESNLSPYGSGAVLNEVDGNLTLWRGDTGIVTLHWQGKIRGLDFKPVLFRIELLDCPDVLDSKGHRVRLPVMFPAGETAVADREREQENTDIMLLKAMRDNPQATVDELGKVINRAKSSVTSRLQRLSKEKLVEKSLNRWCLTAKGANSLKLELATDTPR